ncbi:MAG: hypothetical protein P4L33_13500 [Capsulimonadaceae bacterium]|nr:hypothetical protein [Capsulimonadaceae bacterium]
MMMSKYKTVVVDYEGMQASLDQHAEQGWKLLTVTPDAWRKLATYEAEANSSEGRTENGKGSRDEEFVASYYLLVFVREDDPRFDLGLASASHELPEKGYPIPEF